MEKIKQLIAAGETDEAIRQLDAYIATHATADNAFYLRGKRLPQAGEYAASPQQLSRRDGAESRRAGTHRPRPAHRHPRFL